MNNMYKGWKTATEEQEYLETCHRKQEFWNRVMLANLALTVAMFVATWLVSRPYGWIILGVMIADMVLFLTVVNPKVKFWRAETLKALEDNE